MSAADHRPARPLVVKCTYEGASRRVTFPSAATARLDSLRSRVEECFHLSASPFYLAYVDDDGETCAMRSETDLDEAIDYFGDDDQAESAYSGRPGPSSGVSRIIIRVDVILEYDGPSLSDTSSVSSFRTGSRDDRTESGWESSAYGSYRTGDSASDEGLTEYGAGSATESVRRALDTRLRLQAHPVDASARRFSNSSRSTSRPMTPRPLTGPDSEQAPSLLTHTELGHRWLREQSRMARRPAQEPVRHRRYESDDESFGSDEDLGDLALIRDARGKYYYSYKSTDSGSQSSRSDRDFMDPGPSQEPFYEPVRIAEPAGPPILAPDCSACGVRLEYMRYVCLSCGEGEMWSEHASGRQQFSDERNFAEDEESNGSDTVYNAARPRSASLSTSHGSAHGDAELEMRARARKSGYELCASCIEVHGIAHAKAAAERYRSAMSGTDGRARRRAGELRHTFREKSWAAEGWVDVDYTEDTRCTICHHEVEWGRYKCVSCTRFDLCNSCYQKVEEIHPAHAFLSLPDKTVAPSISRAQATDRAPRRKAAEPSALRHPGAFCHNCMQDIVGPRFHCAVCPSWDLCIQCEGLPMVNGSSGHTADHIMMKIPVPLGTSEVEAVSRKARDRWMQQDWNAVNGGEGSRSPSPTNETVYAPAAHPRAPPTPRDTLDHKMRCSHCSEHILGRRYQCANCPSEPWGYNLCSVCEVRSHRVHDPFHVFFRLDRPVDVPLQSPMPLLPLLYKYPVGAVPSGVVTDTTNPTAYLEHVLHRETLCDIHSDQIRGVWLRCAHCAAGFDICQDAEQIVTHDPTHVFVVFKARVDMTRFRTLADLGAQQSKPLLKQAVFRS